METLNGIPPPSPSPEHFLEALHKKRRSLDLEIERYKALKDEEFQTYESELRRVLEKQPITQPAFPEQPSDFKTSFNPQTEYNGAGRRRNSDEKSPIRTMRERLRIEEEASSPTSESNWLSDVVEKSIELPTTPSHEREIEFHGLFTPNYLPLLEDPHRHSRYNAGNISSQQPSNPVESSNRREDSAAQLSSSATPTVTTYNPLHSPLQSPKLSNSAPRPLLSGERRSSSKSDISITSLRSSLKQPKTPRSPKHVLFAIGNTLLSPSTSPELNRNESVPFIPPSNSTSMPKPSTSRINGVVERIENGRRAARQYSMRSTSLGSQFLDRSYHHLVEPVATRGEDLVIDFENVAPDEDALFSFDEDANHGGANDDDSIDEGPDIDDDKNSTTSSPHSGSLPIEIKWPARKDPRK